MTVLLSKQVSKYSGEIIDLVFDYASNNRFTSVALIKREYNVPDDKLIDAIATLHTEGYLKVTGASNGGCVYTLTSKGREVNFSKVKSSKVSPVGLFPKIMIDELKLSRYHLDRAIQYLESVSDEL